MTTAYQAQPPYTTFAYLRKLETTILHTYRLPTEHCYSELKLNRWCAQAKWLQAALLPSGMSAVPFPREALGFTQIFWSH